MRPDDLIEALQRQPFHPFRIHLSNGHALEVRHPENVKVGRSTAFIFFPIQGQTSAAYERYETVALMHINRLELIEPAQTTHS
jgi:hypothetical protein